MEEYNPSQAPLPDEWLELDELTRIDLVRLYHEDAGVELEEGAENIHAVLHVIVENQLAMDVRPVPETIARLMRQGLKRHEAIHAVGAVLSEDIFNMISGGQELDMKKYRRRLEKLTAKRWLKGKW